MSNTEKIEFATAFALEISKGLLFERKDKVACLTELIKLAFLLDFDVPAVQLLLKLENLRLLEDDELFLAHSSSYRCLIL